MWGHVKTLSLTPTGVQDFFGYSVAVSGTTALVGRPMPVSADGGSVYVYYRDHDTPDNWGEFKKLTASDRYSGAFGESIILSGDVAFISRPYDNLGSDGEMGSVYILDRNEGGADNWGEVNKIAFESCEPLAVSGDTLAVGNPYADVSTQVYQGVVYIWEP